jgi:hypothetical protein
MMQLFILFFILLLFIITSVLYDILVELEKGLGLWCLMPLLAIFQLYRDGQLYWWRELTRVHREDQRHAASH